MHLALAVLNTLLLQVTIAIPLLLFTSKVRDNGWGLAPLLGLRGVPEILATVVLGDFLDYWWHRMNHRVKFFWRFHRVHHWDPELDVTTALRFHIGELALSGVAKALWILVWGPSLWGFAIFEAAISLAAHFHHANFDFKDRTERALRPWIMTPRVHASHHTETLRTRDANYTTILSVWDRWFGSYEEPDRSDQRFGIDAPTGRYLDLPAILAATVR